MTDHLPADLHLDEMRHAAARADVSLSRESAWSVGMHVEHCCLAMVKIHRSLVGSTPPAPRVGFSLRRWIVLRIRTIPRGRVQAPAAVLPSNDSTAEQVLTLVEKATNAVDGLRDVPAGAWFDHPILGVLKRDQCIRFLAVHNKHHLKIVRRILRARNRDAS